LGDQTKNHYSNKEVIQKLPLKNPYMEKLNGIKSRWKKKVHYKTT